jgi:hypothetical protein
MLSTPPFDVAARLMRGGAIYYAPPFAIILMPRRC